MGGVSSTFDKIPSCYGGGHTLSSDPSLNRQSSDAVLGSHLMNHPLRRSRLSEEKGNISGNVEFTESSNKISLVSCAGVTVPSALQHLHGRSYSKLQTLRKKISKLRRRGNNQDYGKQFREFVSGWNYRQLHSLRQEYEALSALKELTVQAMASRPMPSTLKNDLSYLFESGWCSDFQLLYRGTIFNVHQAILTSRCPFFKVRIHNWLAKPDVTYNSGSLSRGTAAAYTAHRVSSGEIGNAIYHFSLPRNSMPSDLANPPMPIEIENCSVDIDAHIFQCLLKYLYSGYLCMEEAHIENWDTLSLLSQKFGIPNTLEEDMEKLLVSSSDTDCVLVFTQTPQSGPSLDAKSNECGCPLCLSVNHLFSTHSTNATSSNLYAAPSGVSSKHRGHYSNCGATPSNAHNECRYLYNCNNPSSNCGLPNTNRNAIQLPPYELHCHKCILAARSRFFRNIILRRMQESVCSLSRSSGDPLGVSSGHVIVPAYTNTLRIVLDESIIPRRLANVILHCIYSDQLDINLVGTPTGCHSQYQRQASHFPNNESAHPFFVDSRHFHPGEASVALDSCRQCLDDVIQLYEIGQFIEFSILSKNCEDLLIKHLSLSNFLHILRWSVQPNGSSFVQRHVSHFIRENFLLICHSPMLFELKKDELSDAISSNFLQARESDVLSAVIRWGEYKLRKIIEEKDPHFTSTAHPHSKKAIKKKDLNDKELAVLLSDLIPLVRLEQVLPSCVDQVHAAIRRGLIPHPSPLYMMQTNMAQNEDRVNYWCRCSFGRQRLVGGIAVNSRSGTGSPTALCESNGAKPPSYLTQSSDPTSVVNVSGTPRSSPPPRKMNQLLESACKSSSFSFKPPRLFTPFYDEVRTLLMEQYKACKSWLDPPGLFNRGTYKHSCDDNQQPCTLTRTNLFDHRVLKAVRKRAKDLEQQLLVQRALLMSCIDRPAVYQQLHLRALRESGMPDEVLFNQLYQLTSPCQTAAWVSPDHPCIHHDSPRRHLGHECSSCGSSPRKYANYKKKNKVICKLHKSSPSNIPFACQDPTCPSWLPFSSVSCPHKPTSDNPVNSIRPFCDSSTRSQSEINELRPSEYIEVPPEENKLEHSGHSEYVCREDATVPYDDSEEQQNPVSSPINNGLVTPFLVRDSIIPGGAAARRSLSQSTSSLSSINQSLDDLRLGSGYGCLSSAPPDITAGINDASSIPPPDSYYGASAYPFHMPSVSTPSQGQHINQDFVYHLRSFSEPFAEDEDMQSSLIPEDPYFYEARHVVATVRTASPEPEDEDEFNDNDADGKYEDTFLFV